VLRPGTARVGVTSGTVTSGELVVEVAPRYEVAGPASYSGDAGWRVGEDHTVRFRLVDRCHEAAPAPAAYSAVRFVADPGVEVRTPLSGSITSAGETEVVLRCTEPDVDVALAMVDAADPARRVEILSTAFLTEQRPPFCLQPR
jgi:hypothetical protein